MGFLKKLMGGTLKGEPAQFGQVKGYRNGDFFIATQWPGSDELGGVMIINKIVEGRSVEPCAVTAVPQRANKFIRWMQQGLSDYGAAMAVFKGVPSSLARVMLANGMLMKRAARPDLELNPEVLQQISLNAAYAGMIRHYASALVETED